MQLLGAGVAAMGGIITQLGWTHAVLVKAHWGVTKLKPVDVSRGQSMDELIRNAFRIDHHPDDSAVVSSLCPAAYTDLNAATGRKVKDACERAKKEGRPLEAGVFDYDATRAPLELEIASGSLELLTAKQRSKRKREVLLDGDDVKLHKKTVKNLMNGIAEHARRAR